MGKALTGGIENKGNVSLLTPEQQTQFSSFVSQLGPQAQQTFGNLLQPTSEQDLQSIFEKTYEKPAQQNLQRNIIPEILQQYGDVNAGSSSALNQALSQSATDLSTQLGQQYGNFVQNQQQQQLQALGQFLPLLTGQTFSPVFEQKQGLAGPLLQLLGSLGGGAIRGGI